MQEYGVDFDEMFSLVVKMTTLRTILCSIVAEDMELVEMDILNSFPLNGLL